MRDLEGRQRFGAWLRQHRLDSRLWPPGLREWFEKRYSFGSGDRLTQSMLCQWLSTFGQGDFSRYVYRVKCVEAWADAATTKDMRGAVDLELGNVLVVSQLLSIPTLSGDSLRVSHTREIVAVLQGRLNPFSMEKVEDRFVDKTIPKKLSLFLQDIVAREDLDAFVGSQWQPSEALPGGRLQKLYDGEIEEIREDDISAIARCVQEWRKKDGVKKYKFTPSDLIRELNKAQEDHQHHTVNN